MSRRRFPLHRARSRRRSGVILLTLSWLVVLMALMLASQLQEAEVDLFEQGLREDALRRRLAARSVLHMVTAALEADAAADAGKKTAEGDAAESAEPFDAFSEPWGWQSLRESFGETLDETWPALEITVAIEDEDSKVNLRGASPEALGILLQEMGWPRMRAVRMAEDLIELTRRSLEPVTVAAGAAAPPGPPAEPQLPDLRYLLTQGGVAAEFLYGEDRNFNGVLDPGENDGAESLPLDNRDGMLQRGLCAYVTLLGEGKPNPNTAPPEVLRTVPGVSRLIAEEITSLREGGDGVLGTPDDFVFGATEDLMKLASLSRFRMMEYDRIAPHLNLKSERFTVRICVAEDDGRAMTRIQACVGRQKDGGVRVLSYLEDNGV